MPPVRVRLHLHAQLFTRAASAEQQSAITLPLQQLRDDLCAQRICQMSTYARLDSTLSVCRRLALAGLHIVAEVVHTGSLADLHMAVRFSGLQELWVSCEYPPVATAGDTECAANYLLQVWYSHDAHISMHVSTCTPAATLRCGSATYPAFLVQQHDVEWRAWCFCILEHAMLKAFMQYAASQATQVQGLYLQCIPSLDVRHILPPALAHAVSSSIQLTSLEVCRPIRLEAVSGLTRLQKLALWLWHLDDGQDYDLQVCRPATCNDMRSRKQEVQCHSALMHRAANG